MVSYRKSRTSPKPGSLEKPVRLTYSTLQKDYVEATQADGCHPSRVPGSVRKPANVSTTRAIEGILAPVANKRIHSMIARAETPELHFLAVFNLFRVAIAPLKRDFGVSVCVHEYVESTVPIQHGQEGH